MKGMLKKTLLLALSAGLIVLAFGSYDVLAKGKATHNVTYIYGTNTVTVPVAHGANAPLPTDTYVAGYNFKGWVGNPNIVTEDRVILGAYDKVQIIDPLCSTPTYTAKWSNNKSAPNPDWWKNLNLPKGVPGKTCAVHWFNGWNGELWRTDIVPYGSSIPNPPDPCLAGYEFIGWDGSWTNITEDRAIMACYYVKHRLKFVDEFHDDDYIDIQYVRDGEGAWIDPPSHDGYKFMYYEKDTGGEYHGEGVHDDHTLTARYKKKD